MERMDEYKNIKQKSVSFNRYSDILRLLCSIQETLLKDNEILKGYIKQSFDADYMPRDPPEHGVKQRSKSSPYRKKAMIWKGDHGRRISPYNLNKIQRLNSFSDKQPTQPKFKTAEMFTPEIEDKHKKTYRFMCPHAGQFECSLTRLVFVIEGKGELLYRVVSWDPRQLHGLGQMQPAGPLYDIKCSACSFSQLHFPHCEVFSEESKDSLAVAHFTGDNIAIMKPLEVTETHVAIDVNDLSIFGLIKNFFLPSPVVAQVLVFLRPVEEFEKILNVFLLPWNVPLTEVINQRPQNIHLDTSSMCFLTPGLEYRLSCQTEGSRLQPPSEKFYCNFGPNYFPTFEVFVNINTAEVSLGLLNEAQEVWVPRRIPLPGSEFVRRHRDALIERVSSVLPIADTLLTRDMITHERYNEILAAEPQQQKMRLLLDALDAGGNLVRDEFYKLLVEKEPHLVQDLERREPQ